MKTAPDWFGCGRTITQASWNGFLAAQHEYWKAKDMTLPSSDTPIDYRPYGSAMRRLREAAGFGLNETADAMGISAPYLCDLEYGRRAWSEDLTKKFKKALKAKP